MSMPDQYYALIGVCDKAYSQARKYSWAKTSPTWLSFLHALKDDVEIEKYDGYLTLKHHRFDTVFNPETRQFDGQYSFSSKKWESELKLAYDNWSQYQLLLGREDLHRKFIKKINKLIKRSNGDVKQFVKHCSFDLKVEGKNLRFANDQINVLVTLGNGQAHYDDGPKSYQLTPKSVKYFLQKVAKDLIISQKQ